MWPSAELADIALRRLEAHRHRFPFRHIKYPDAGHLILVHYWPLTVRAVGLRVEGFAGYLYRQAEPRRLTRRPEWMHARRRSRF